MRTRECLARYAPRRGGRRRQAMVDGRMRGVAFDTMRDERGDQLEAPGRINGARAANGRRWIRSSSPAIKSDCGTQGNTFMRKERSKAVDTILAEFPGPVVLVRSELQRFFDMGFAMLLGASALYYLWQHRSLGGAALALAVLGLAGCIALRRPTLRLDRHRFVHGRTARRWDEVKDFRLWGACPTMLICHSDRPQGVFLGPLIESCGADIS